MCICVTVYNRNVYIVYSTISEKVKKTCILENNIIRIR